MVTQLEVFADITCPFTHVGLKRVVAELDEHKTGAQIVVRAWPLEWVNGEPLDVTGVGQKIRALREQLKLTAFGGFRQESWPTTTIPALNLAAAGYRCNWTTGLGVSLALRDALFEDGSNVSDPVILKSIADRFDLEPPSLEPDPDVQEDYEDGKQRGVRGSPDFWLGDDEFFCPALSLVHDDRGLTAKFDEEGLRQFISQIQARSRE